MNYSLLVMESAGMMKMATGDDSPLRQGAGTGSRLVFSGCRGLRQWTPHLGFFSGVSVFIGIFGVGLTSGGSPSRPRGRGRAQGVGRTLHPRGWPGTLLAQLFYFRVFFWFIKNRQKLAGQLDSVWYSFSVNSKTRKKQEVLLGSRLIG